MDQLILHVMITGILLIAIIAIFIILFIWWRRAHKLSSQTAKMDCESHSDIFSGTVQSYEAIMAIQTSENDWAKSTAYQSCSICLSSYNSHDEVIKLCCGHLYHADCIRMWFKEAPHCPYCRRSSSKAPCTKDDNLQSYNNPSSHLSFYYR